MHSPLCVTRIRGSRWIFIGIITGYFIYLIKGICIARISNVDDSRTIRPFNFNIILSDFLPLHRLFLQRLLPYLTLLYAIWIPCHLTHTSVKLKIARRQIKSRGRARVSEASSNYLFHRFQCLSSLVFCAPTSRLKLYTYIYVYARQISRAQVSPSFSLHTRNDAVLCTHAVMLKRSRARRPWGSHGTFLETFTFIVVEQLALPSLMPRYGNSRWMWTGKWRNVWRICRRWTLIKGSRLSCHGTFAWECRARGVGGLGTGWRCGWFGKRKVTEDREIARNHALGKCEAGHTTRKAKK